MARWLCLTVGLFLAADCSFNKMRGRMVQCGVRPNKFTFKLETEGHVKLKDPRSAMGAVKSLRTAAGGVGVYSQGVFTRVLYHGRDVGGGERV
jgi:hypothetical protein